MDGIDGNDLTFSNFNVKEESSSGDEEGNEESKVAVEDGVVNSSAATANPNSFTSSFYKKETIEEQMDWLSVNVNDI
jgi:hypothetical protein